MLADTQDGLIKGPGFEWSRCLSKETNLDQTHAILITELVFPQFLN